MDQVPPGRVTSFKALGEALGDARAAKAIFQILRDERPRGWHRVVRSDGSLSFPEASRTLRTEGVSVSADRVGGFQQSMFAEFDSPRPLERLREEQRALSRRVVLEDLFGELATVAGFDVSYEGQRAYAAAVVLDWPDLGVVEEATVRTRASFPYISTYLAYREFEPIARCYRRLQREPSLILVDGNGVLHPASFGIACLTGVKLDRPTIGVAKSLLMGTLEAVPMKQGEVSPVAHRGRVLGYAYKSARQGKPIYISPGHKVSPQTAVRLVKGLCRDRIPEALRLAHLASRRLKRERAA